MGFVRGKRKRTSSFKSHAKSYFQMDYSETTFIDSGYTINEFPENMEKLKNLQKLKLSSTVRVLPENIGNLTNLQRFDMSLTQISELPKSIGDLRNLQRLDLSSTQVSELPESIGNLSNLQSMILSSTQIKSLPESIGNLSSLQYLYFRSGVIDELPESIGNLTRLQSLNLSSTLIKSLPESIGDLNNLQRLDLSSSQIRSLPEGIGNLKNLRCLYLNNSKIDILPESIADLKNLQRLDLSSTQISELPESIGNLTNLQTLDLRFTQIRSLPESIRNLTNLQHLYLSGMQINSLPESIGALANLHSMKLDSTQIKSLPENIGGLTNLQFLSLSKSDLSELPESIRKLTNLEKLDLSSTKINELPESIGNLSTLKVLILEDLTLSELPESLLHLNLEYNDIKHAYRWNKPGIYIYNLKLKNQPVDIFSQGRELIIEYYKSLRQEETIPLNECKVVFLGDGGVGKSLAIYRLLNNGINVSQKRDKSKENVWNRIREVIKPSYDEFNGETTPGIAISTQKCIINGEDVRINYWDFGGQEILHSMHRMFLTQRTIYVVMVNARENTLDERARYWVNNIKSFAHGAPILIVINQIDQNLTASLNESSLRKLYPYILPNIIKMSALKDSQDKFNHALRDEIHSGIYDMDSVHSVIPKSWKKLIDNVRGITENYMMMDKFESLCMEYNVIIYGKFKADLIDWFQDIGVSFCYRKDRSLEDYMLLEPKWIVNAIYTILFNGRLVSKNGIILKNDLYTILKDDVITVKGIDKEIKRVQPDLRYKGFEVGYVLGVIKRFKLSYELYDDSIFFPMLCDRDEKISAIDAVGCAARHTVYKYSYLPENVVHRIIVDMKHDLDYENVWFSGAVFSNRSGLKAYVNAEDKELHIFTNSIDPFYKATDYLNRFRESVKITNNELGLSAKEYVTYRLDNVEAEFLYDDLIGSLRTGGTQIYSNVHHKQINIAQILDQYKDNSGVNAEIVIDQMLSVLGEMSERCSDLQKRGEVELTADFQSAIAPVLNEKFCLQVAREYTLGRANKKTGETDLYFFTYKGGIKKEQYILENKNINNFTDQYMQLMGYLNPNFSAGITLSINTKKGWEEAFDYICGKLNALKNTADSFSPISINRYTNEKGTKYVKTEHIVPETGLTMPIYHLILQLSDDDRLKAATKARNTIIS